MGNDGHDKKRDMTYTQNRELSWLRFDERVLAESMDESVPLFERLKFIAIFESNMREFLMVRMGGLSSLATLKRQPRDNKSGMTPSEQVAAVFSELPGLERRLGHEHERRYRTAAHAARARRRRTRACAGGAGTGSHTGPGRGTRAPVKTENACRISPALPSTPSCSGESPMARRWSVEATNEYSRHAANPSVAKYTE